MVIILAYTGIASAAEIVLARLWGSCLKIFANFLKSIDIRLTLWYYIFIKEVE